MTVVTQNIKAYYLRFRSADIPTRAAALAYHTLLAIVPMVGLFFWYLTSIGVTAHYLDLSKVYIMSQLNVSSSKQFEETFQRLTSKVAGNSWGYVGLALLIYTATNLMMKFADALDSIIGTAKNSPASGFTAVALTVRRLIVMLGLPIALTLSFVVSDWVRTGSLLRYVFDLKTVGSYFAFVIPVVADLIIFFFIYHFIPRNPVPWRQALKAASVVAPLSEMVRFGFSLYNSYAVSVYKIYGVLAIIPLFILWVQVAWIVILSGALLIRFKSER